MTSSMLKTILCGATVCATCMSGSADGDDVIVAGDVVVVEAAVEIAEIDVAVPAVAVQAPAAAAPAINPAAAVPAEALPAEEDPQVAAIRQQFEPLMRVELSFANRVCQWTDDERIAAVKVARQWQRDFAREYAKNNGQRNRGFMLMAGNNNMAQQGPAQEQPDHKLAAALERDAMTDEQRKAYQAERAHRAAFRAEATIETIIALMDQKLELTPEQRRQIRKTLRKTWSEDWAPPLAIFVQMPEYIPAFPDEQLVEILTPEQRSLWQRVQRISAQGVFFGGNMFGNDVPPINDVDLDEGQ